MEYVNIRTVAVVGAGTLGRQIADVAARSGFPVTLVKATPGDLSLLDKRVRAPLEREVSSGRMKSADAEAISKRLTVASELEAIRNADVVIESIIEDPDHKRRILDRIVALAKPTAILCSNTSTLPVGTLVPDEVAARFAGLHFFSPVRKMALCEIGPTKGTAPEVVAALQTFARSMGKTVVPVAPTPGYIVNRLLVPQLLAAIRALASGIAPAPSIDQAMALGLGHPMGPLALCDLIGNDIVFEMSRTLYRELGDPGYKAPALLRRLVQDGALGRKTKLGFYDYKADKPVPNPILAELILRSGIQAA